MSNIKNDRIAHRLSQGMVHLKSRHILLINEALGAVGEFGEVHLKIENGRLRFVITQTSHDALKYLPGELSHQGKNTE